MAIVDRGSIIRQGPISELLAGALITLQVDAEQPGVGPDRRLHLDLGAERLAGPGDAGLGQRHRQAALGHVVRRAHQALADRLQADLLHLHLDREVDPRRRAAHQVVHDGEVLAAAELLAGAAEQHDDVALALEPLRRVVGDVGRAGRPCAMVGVGGIARPSVSL